MVVKAADESSWYSLEMNKQMDLNFSQCCKDRNDLLAYVLTVNFERLVLPPGVTSLKEVNLADVEVQYVIDCAKRGGSLELVNAMKNSCIQMPPMLEEPSVSPDPVPVITLPQKDLSPVETSYKSDINLKLRIPLFKTGLSEDDIRETAYEVLLASGGAAGGLIALSKDRKEDKRSSIPRRVQHKNEKAQTSGPSGLAGLMETMRALMKITEEGDKRTKEALLQVSAGRLGKRVDGIILPLELLCLVRREDFSDQHLYLLWQKRQLNVLKEGILNTTNRSTDVSGRYAKDLETCMSSFLESENIKSSTLRAESLKKLKDVCSMIVGKAEQTGEIFHWADGYFLNVRLYEMLLGSIFNVVRPNLFVEEVDEILELLKSTWRVLGITQTVHDTCLTWVIFKQSVCTDDFNLLENAALQMRKIPPNGQRTVAERAYLKKLRTVVDAQEVSYVQSVLIPIKQWADEYLNDYHLHFNDSRDRMETILLLAMTSGGLIAHENDQELKYPETNSTSKQAEYYVSTSVRRAYARVIGAAGDRSREKNVHQLTLLAEDVTGLAKKDASLFLPFLSRWAPKSAAMTAAVLHNEFHNELKPLLDGSQHLKEDDLASVLRAADNLEQHLLDMIASVDNGDEGMIAYKQRIIPYEIESISDNMNANAVNDQLSQLSSFVENSFSEEDWEVSSPEQPYGKSAIQIFSFIEKEMEEFFCRKLPMRISHLKALTEGVDSAIKLYCRKIIGQLGDMGDLIPPAPALSRHRKETSIRAFSKKKVSDPRLPDEKRSNELNMLTTAQLCLRLNTIHYMHYLIDNIKETTKERWKTKMPRYGQTKPVDDDLLFFNGSLEALRWALNHICEFAGSKIIFWDMRETFVNNLYRTGVSECRMEKVVNGLDLVLGQLCEVLLTEPLRDQVVSGLLHASLNGLEWVLLDGGPFRFFSQTDANLLEEDLKMLKDFFIADGDGLPKGLVENAAGHVQYIVDMYRLEGHGVVDKFKRANSQVVVKSSAQATEADVLLRVLCHRTDRDAAKFLKQCKLLKH